jgi:tetratricopeptide (TPR) repeat protein
VHKSLRDWLTRRIPATHLPQAGEFAVDVGEGELLLAEYRWRCRGDQSIRRHPYLCRYLAEHLAAAGQTDRLLTLAGDLDIFEQVAERGWIWDWMRLLRRLPESIDRGALYLGALDALGPGSSDRDARLADQLGDLLRRMGLSREALALSERAVRLQESAGGGPSLGLAGSLRHLAELFRVEKRFDQALPFYDRAMEMYLALCGPDSAEVADVSHDLAEFYRDQGRYVEAMAYNDRALRIRRQAARRDPRGIGDCLNDAGVMLFEHFGAAASSRAMAYYTEALRVFEEAFGRADVAVATCLHNIAQLDPAPPDERDLESLREAFAILDAAYAPTQRDLQGVRRTLASHYQGRARFGEAIELRSEVVHHSGIAFGPESEEARTDQARLERTARRQREVIAQIAAARRTLELAPARAPGLGRCIEAVDRLTESVGQPFDPEPLPGPPVVGARAGRGIPRPTDFAVDATFQLGAYLCDYGYPAAAVPVLEAAYATWRGVEPRSGAVGERVLDRLVRAHAARKQWSRATARCRERLDLLATLDPVPVPLVRAGWARLGDLAFDQGDYDAALEHYERSVAGGDGGADAPLRRGLGTRLNDRALVLKNRKGEYEQAGRYYRRGLELDPQSALIAGNLALLLTSTRGEHDDAEALYRRSLAEQPTGSVQGNFAFFLQHVRRDLAAAERHYRESLSLDPADVNNYSNYATLQMTQGNLAAAAELVTRAWHIRRRQADDPIRDRRQAHDRISARILLVGAVLAWRIGRPTEVPLGQLRLLLGVDLEHAPWACDQFREWLATALPPAAARLADRLIGALCDRAQLAAVEALPEWLATKVVPFDVEWPDLS